MVGAGVLKNLSKGGENDEKTVGRLNAGEVIKRATQKFQLFHFQLDRVGRDEYRFMHHLATNLGLFFC